MADDRSRPALEAALERLLETIKTAALVLFAQDRVVLEQAVARARASCLALQGRPDGGAGGRHGGG